MGVLLDIVSSSVFLSHNKIVILFIGCLPRLELVGL